MVRRSGVWRRTSGLTLAREAFVSPEERQAGLGRLVRQLMTVSLARREDGVGADASAEARTVPAEFAARASLAPEFVRQDSFNEESGTPAVSSVSAVPAVAEWVAVKMDCDPVGRACAKLEISQAKLSVLTKEYCGLSTREVCDAARVARVKPAVRQHVIDTALACWGRPGVAAQLYCLRGGVLPREADALRAQRRGGGSAYFVERTRATFAPLMDPGVAREDLVEKLRGQLMAAVDARRTAAEFDREAWAVGLGFASFGRLKRACVVVLGKAVRQMELEACAEVVEHWLAVESDVVLKLARAEKESSPVLRARWLFQGHEGPVPAAARSRLEWLRELDPGGAWEW